jgi:hypothetical protein
MFEKSINRTIFRTKSYQQKSSNKLNSQKSTIKTKQNKTAEPFLLSYRKIFSIDKLN